MPFYAFLSLPLTDEHQSEEKKNWRWRQITHTNTIFLLVLWSVHGISWVFIPAVVCSVQAGNLLFIYVFSSSSSSYSFCFVQIYHQTFIVVQVSSRLSSCYVPSTLLGPETERNNKTKCNAFHRKLDAKEYVFIWTEKNVHKKYERKKTNDISLAPDYRIEIIRFVVVLPFCLFRFVVSPYFNLYWSDFYVRSSMSDQLIAHTNLCIRSELLSNLGSPCCTCLLCCVPLNSIRI